MISIPRLTACALVLSACVASRAVSAPPNLPAPRGPLPPLELVLLDLGLSEAQRSTIDVLLDAHHAALDAKREDARAAHEALHRAVVADEVDEEAIRAAAAVVAESEAERFVADAKLLHDVRALLTKSQRAQLAETLAKPARPPFRGGPPRGERPR